MGFTTRLALAGLALGVASANPMGGNGTVYTTEVVTALTTYCPAATTLTHGGKTYTVTEATTLTITDCPCTITKPTKPTATGPAKDACAEGCMNVYDKCRVAKGANMAYCASQYANCLGYSPFGGDGSLKTPTACSTKPSATAPVKDVVYTTEVVTAVTTYCPEPTTLVYGNKTIHVTQPGTVTVTDCPCTIRRPEPSSAPGCAEQCMDAYNKCRTAKGANMSYCASQYAGCLGYNPFGGDGSLVTPTACSHGGQPGYTAPPAAGQPTQPGQPGAGQPGKPQTTGPVSTPVAPVPAGAGRAAPAGIALALGALAFL